MREGGEFAVKVPAFIDMPSRVLSINFLFFLLDRQQSHAVY